MTTSAPQTKEPPQAGGGQALPNETTPPSQKYAWSWNFPHALCALEILTMELQLNTLHERLVPADLGRSAGTWRDAPYLLLGMTDCAPEPTP